MPRKRRPAVTPPVLPQPSPRLAARIMPPPQREARDAEQADGYDKPVPRRKGGKMDDETFDGIIRAALEAGRQYDEDQLRSDRLTAMDFYTGDMSIALPPNENGSSVVSYDVRDMVHAVMPSIERIFFASDCPVEFVPEQPRDDKFAPLATRYVNKIIRDRLGVIGLRSVMMDVMLAKVGVVAWWWDDAQRVTVQKFTGLDDVAYAFVTDPPDDKTTIDVIEETPRAIPPDAEEVQAALAMQQAGQQVPAPQPTQVRDCVVRYTTKRRVLRIEAVPPEERVMDPGARTPETARFRGRRMTKAVHELVALGYDRDEVLEHANVDPDTDPDLSQDAASRQPQGFAQMADVLPDDDYKQVEYCELWIKVDRDGDGIAELVKVCTVGDEFHVLHEEPASQVQMAEFQMIPIPHTVSGRALADNLIDVQTIKTSLWRGVMESLPHSIYPRYVGVEGKVNWDDLLNNTPGQPIRVKEIGAAVPFTVDFVGQAALSVMQFIDDNVRDQRTGVSKAAQGLDPDALQSTPTAAASAMVGATQTQLEDYARMLGATGFRDLYRGLLREVVANQKDPDWMRVNGEWEEVDPRPWNADLDVTIDVTGGTHGASQKVPVLQAIAAAQQAAMTSLGPDNPLVGLAEIYNVQAKIVNLTGVGRVDQFWRDPAKMPDWKPQPPPGQPDPNAAAAALAQSDLKKAQISDDTKRYELQLVDDRERDKNEADVVLRSFDTASRTGMMPPWQEILSAMRMPRPPSTLPAPPNPQNPPPGQPPAPGAAPGPPGALAAGG